jgi:branched-chain amino acid transport system substrate-binding protein
MDTENPMLLPGVRVTLNGDSDGYPIQAAQMMKFNGENWELQGDVIEAQ